jgi:hypothetical protein
MLAQVIAGILERLAELLPQAAVDRLTQLLGS